MTRGQFRLGAHATINVALLILIIFIKYFQVDLQKKSIQYFDFVKQINIPKSINLVEQADFYAIRR